MIRAIRRAVVLTAVAGLVVACGGSAPDTGASLSSASASASPTGSMLVAGDVRYATSEADSPWGEQLLDVYAPAGAQGLPLVVLFHGAVVGKGAYSYPRLAAELAHAGAVVVSADWDVELASALADMGNSVEQIVARQAQTVDELACAVDFAVSHAQEYGADPTRLVLVGHSAGANMVSTLALSGRSAPFPGCLSPKAPWCPRGLMLWEGDWLLEDPTGDWDSFGRDLGTALMPAFTPWKALGEAPRDPVEFAVADTSRKALCRANPTPGDDWLELRDPKGTIRARLEAQNASDEGCVDVGEESDALAAEMTDIGIPARVLALTDRTTDHSHLADADVTRMADHILALANA